MIMPNPERGSAPGPGRPRSRAEVKEQQQESVRRYILDLARQMVIDHGYAGLSIRRLAEAAGYAPGTIYLYYKSRDEIARAIAAEVYRDLLAAMQAALAAAAAGPATADAPERRLEALLRAYAQFALDNPASYRLAFVEDPRLVTKPADPSDNAAALQALSLLIDAVAGLLVGSPAVNQAPRLAESAWLALHGVAAILVSCPGYDASSPAEMVDSVIRLVIAGLLEIGRER